ncbi:MAG: hypothetical protein M3R59_00605 [Verrucomicrobiota bacterium]|nr:hypothetical protein [Verrucomicrobiota bacterium]
MNPTLIFSWAAPRKFPTSFIAFLIGSVVIHALCFSLFQIVYPSTAALLPPPARLTLIDGHDNPEAQALLHWVEAEDPALAMTTQRAPDASSQRLPNLRHVPSYAGHEPKLRDLPPVAPDLRIPSIAPPGPVEIPGTASATTKLRSSQPTAVLLDNGSSIATPSFSFRASRDGAPENARFHIALDPSGTVRHALPIASSNDRALDEQATNFLQLCRFPPSTDEERWIVVTILWGNNIAAPEAKAKAAP